MSYFKKVKNQIYSVEEAEWKDVSVSNIGVHLCTGDITTTTGIVLVDLSDTTNFPHNYTGGLCITGYQITISPSSTPAFVGRILLGFVENVDATDGDFKPMLCWNFNKGTSVNVNENLALASPLCANSTNFLVPGNVNDTTWQTDTALISPYDNVAPYTTAPGDGDLVMKVSQTTGSVEIGITLKYFSKP